MTVKELNEQIDKLKFEVSQIKNEILKKNLPKFAEYCDKLLQNPKIDCTSFIKIDNIPGVKSLYMGIDDRYFKQINAVVTSPIGELIPCKFCTIIGYSPVEFKILITHSRDYTEEIDY